MPTKKTCDEMKYLLKGPIDKPAYFVIKNTETEFDTSCINCTLVKKEGGFIFYKREAVIKK